MFDKELKIPEERVGVLIGEKGRDKRRIEKRLKVKLKVSKEGDVVISGEGLELLIAEKVVKAIGRGFNPDIALLLQNENFDLELIDITDFAGRSKKKMIRLRGRLIGSKGKSRKNIEEMTETFISVFGKTVAIVGNFEKLALARKAIEMILTGAQHSTVYRYLERMKRESLQ